MCLVAFPPRKRLHSPKTAEVLLLFQVREAATQQAVASLLGRCTGGKLKELVESCFEFNAAVTDGLKQGCIGLYAHTHPAGS